MKRGIPARRPYQGVRQIFTYNRPFYIWTLSGVMAAIFLSMWLPVAFGALILFASVPAVFWTCSSLLVSHYIYDRPTFYSLGWLCGCLSQAPIRWINVHAGLDESSLAIASMFPNSQGHITDIYDPREMTEPSIRRARRIAKGALVGRPQLAPATPDVEFDAAFLIFAAHELRRREARVGLFREMAHELRIGGELVLVEHLRDWANFLAFGPGFLHFFSERTWLDVAKAAGLLVRSQRTLTPFVHVFVFRRQR